MYKYQLIFLGNYQLHASVITSILQGHIRELGISEDMLTVIEPDSEHLWDKEAPTVALYFGLGVFNFEDESFVQDLQAVSAFIIPIVDNIGNFYILTPVALQPINGFELSQNNIHGLVSLILEGFGLLRLSRRIFISYRRADSTGLALQLYEMLDAKGFHVFLDTHSVPRGVDFQEELWHQLANTDVMLMIDSPGFRESQWSLQELAKAAAMSIGIFQLIWPRHNPPKAEDFAFTMRLRRRNFRFWRPGRNRRIHANLLPEISEAVESLRARNLAARQKLLIHNFLQVAKNNNRQATFTTERYISFKAMTMDEIAVIPAVGIPDSFLLYTKEILIGKLNNGLIKKVVILYDQTNVREQWELHLGWLNNNLQTVSSVSLGKIAHWIQHN